MEQNMTALVSLFARAYHQKNKDIKIFDDLLSTKLITEKEYEMIGLNMSQGISFFNPTFKGSKEEALKWIVDHQLSPSVLLRSAFCKEAIEEMKEKGCQQYLDFASGYDSFAYYYQNQMHVFEIDKKEVIEDKRQRCKDVYIENIQFLSIDLSQENWINTLLQSDYQEDQLSISSMLGLSYYLTKDEFKKMLKQLSKYLLKGSRLVFDYPSIQESKETKINEMLAKEADESMKAKYSFAELKEILNQCHLTIIQHKNHQTMTEKYISNYNVYYKDDPIKAPEGVCYCVVEK
ncbi:class I SAM-dependent methyltransferase [Faecalibacillus faecis]|uniref:class I SAM-dependent methyltransferase n=1 Tax=Faecalibacillus faecis TaxID=1982628 RepID=UPI000E50C67D|nr:class I SAM-dependent methyltransferase [Faecalibacillus faecis]RHB07146.1 SAM-dependent methyltransferase [Coprobacillus sp. AM42-12AC]